MHSRQLQLNEYPLCSPTLQGDKYVDKQRYKESQPDKKKGFLTSDFSKRDEFSNTIRTNQWREQLTVSVESLMAMWQDAGVAARRAVLLTDT